MHITKGNWFGSVSKKSRAKCDHNACPLNMHNALGECHQEQQR